MLPLHKARDRTRLRFVVRAHIRSKRIEIANDKVRERPEYYKTTLVMSLLTRFASQSVIKAIGAAICTHNQGGCN